MKNIYYKLGAWMSVLSVFLIPTEVFAQLKPTTDSTTDLAKVKAKLDAGGTTTTELPVLIGGLINAFLSVLGIIFVVMVIYAGYLWMTDAGAGDKVKKAKGLLGTAIIGLIIVVAAYAISAFVIDKIVTAAA